jgi:hypothetical protein
MGTRLEFQSHAPLNRHNMYKLREERLMKPETFGHLVSATLYERRFGPYFCGPVRSMAGEAAGRGAPSPPGEGRHAYAGGVLLLRLGCFRIALG